MSRQIDYKKLLQKLKELADLLPQINPEKAFRDIKGMDTRPHDQLIRECRDFQDRVERLAEDCQDVIERPVYIGVIGHYSHGKSSLLNALLFPPKSPACLPVGEGVVTSMCTLVQFEANSANHEFFEVEVGGMERLLLPDEYQARVAGKGKNLGGLSHFRVRLSVPNLDDPLFSEFATRNIDLLDTPGLGGPYWKDEHALMRWIKEFEMVVVCIKATEINEVTAITVNPFLRQFLRKCIPVVTFWDMWRKCPDFKGISEEVKARAEAKRKISQFFPVLDGYVDDTVFVSAKACMEAKEVPAEESRFFTEQWNIDNVRRILASQVRGPGPGPISKPEDSMIDTQRRSKIRQLTEQLCSSFNQYAANLKQRMDGYRPEGEHLQVVAEIKADVTRDLDTQIDRIATRLEKHFNDRISAIGPRDDWSGLRDQAKDQALNEYRELRQQAVKQLITNVERAKTSRLDPLVKSLGLKREVQGRLDRDFQRVLDDFSRDSQSWDGNSSDVVVTKGAGVEIGIGIGEAIKKTIGDIVRTYGIYGIAFLILYPFAWWLLRLIPYGTVIALGILGFVLLGIAGKVISNAGQVIEKTRMAARNKTLTENSHSKVAQRVDKDLGDSFRRIFSALSRMADEHLSPIDSQTVQILDSLKTSLDKLDEVTYDIKSLI